MSGKMINPKISVVTVSFNSAATIKETLDSVKHQDYHYVEHIIIDGASTDNTLEIVEREKTSIHILISEPDKGIYDAMNKGFHNSSGDIVAFLNSDDVYHNKTVLSKVANAFVNEDVDYVYGNLEILDNDGRLLRNWKPGVLSSKGLDGNQLPHPAFFVKKSVLKSISPPFDSNLKISADIKQQLIIINKLKCKGYYIDEPLTIMSNGGASTNSLSSYILGWKETKDSYNEIFGNGGLNFTIRKVLSKFRGVKSLLGFWVK